MWRRMIKEMRSHPGNRLFATLILVFLLPAVAFAQQFDTAGEKLLLELINKDRAEAGVPPLAQDERLTQAARQHTQLMVQHNELTHQFAGEPALQVRVANEGLRSDRQAENVGLEMDVPGAHAMLMNSPAHRANILSPDYNAIGIGVIQVGDQLYVTEDFAHRLADYSDADADVALQKAITDYATAHRIPAPVRKAQPELHDMACHMAVIDALDTRTPRSIPGVHKVMVWTATEVAQLPTGVKALVGQPLPNGYSLGICFAGNPTHPGGIYWIVLVAY